MAKRSNPFVFVKYGYICNLSNNSLSCQGMSKSFYCNHPSSHVLAGNVSYKPLFQVWAQDYKLKGQIPPPRQAYGYVY